MDRNYLNPFHNARLAMALYREKLEQANSWIDIGSDYKRKDNLDNNMFDDNNIFDTVQVPKNYKYRELGMSKRDYEKIAKAIRAEVDSHEDMDMYKASSILKACISRLCMELKADNPNFDSEKFKDASLGTLAKRPIT